MVCLSSWIDYLRVRNRGKSLTKHIYLLLAHYENLKSREQLRATQTEIVRRPRSDNIIVFITNIIDKLDPS